MQKLQKHTLKVGYILLNRLLLKAHRPPLDQQSPLFATKAHPNTQKAQAHISKPVFLLSGFGPFTTKAHKVTKFPAKKTPGFVKCNQILFFWAHGKNRTIAYKFLFN